MEGLDDEAHLVEICDAGGADREVLLEADSFILLQAFFQVVGYQLRQFLARQFGFVHDPAFLDAARPNSKSSFQECYVPSIAPGGAVPSD